MKYIISVFISFFGFCLPMYAQMVALDPTFKIDNGSRFFYEIGEGVLDVAAYPDNKVLISSANQRYNGQVINGLVRLNADGTIDNTFQNGAQTNIVGYARKILLLPDGKVLLVGRIVSIGNVVVNGILRLNADGTHDATFNSGTGVGNGINNQNNTKLISDVALQSDGKIIIVGTFDVYNGVTRNKIARLNSNGSLDTSFDAGIGFTEPNEFYHPTVVKIQPDGKILVGGNFTKFNGLQQVAIVRLNTNATKDTSFTFDSGGFVSDIAVLSNGKILLAGVSIITNYSISPWQATGLVRLNADSSIDASFIHSTPSATSLNSVARVAVLPNQKLMITGGFTGHLRRLHENGVLDSTFQTDTIGPSTSSFRVLTVRPDGKILAGGSISKCGQHYVGGIMGTNEDGSLMNNQMNMMVTCFHAEFNNTFGLTAYLGSYIRDIYVQPDGKYLVAGNFSVYGGFASTGLTRLNADGTPDAVFQTNVKNAVDFCVLTSVTMQSDGKVVVGGIWKELNSPINSEKRGIIRFNSNGTRDNTFISHELPPASPPYIKVLAQPSNKILILHDDGYEATDAHNLQRLMPNGGLDNTFPTLYTSGAGLHLLPNGNIIVGAGLVNENGVGIPVPQPDNLWFDYSSVDAIAVQPDGKVILGGSFWGHYDAPGAEPDVPFRNLIRLNADMSYDPTFHAGDGIASGIFADPNYFIHGLALQPDGKIIVVGKFLRYNNIPVANFMRLNPDGSLDNSTGAGILAESQVLNDIMYSSSTNNTRVFVAKVLPDNKILLGGNFSHVQNFAPSIRMARYENTNVAAPPLIMTDILQTPVITTSTIASILNNLPSASERIRVWGSNLISNVTTVCTSTDWEFSINNVTWASSLNIPQNNGLLIGQPLNLRARLKAGTGKGTYNDTLKLLANGATTRTVLLRGQINGSFQSITFNLPTPKTYEDAPFALNATSTSGGPITYTSSNSNIISISGNIATVVNAGTCQITATQEGTNVYNAATNTKTIVVNKKAQTITFSLGANANKTFGDAPFTVSATGGNSGNLVTFGSNMTNRATVSENVITIVGAGTVQITATQQGNNNYLTGSATQTLTIAKANQTITFNALPTKTFGDAPFVLNASTSSNLAMGYSSSNTSVATVTNGVVTIVGAGTTDITISQAGNSNYNAATSVVQTLTVNKANQTITFNALPTKTFGDAPFALNASVSSNLAMGYSSSNTSVATVTNGVVTIVGAGTTDITISQAGNSNYNAATSVVQTLTVNKANQTITFNALPTKTFGDAPFALNASTSSNLAMGYSSSNTSVATVTNGVVTIVGAGTTDITISQAGNFNYNAATSVVQTLTVNKANQTITFNALPTKTFGDAPFALNASASSNLEISYSSSNTNVATVSGNTVTIVGTGTTIITASQNGNENYLPATSVSQDLVVNKANQTITFNAIADKVYGNLPFQLNATSNSNLAVSYSISTLPATGVATLSGNTVTIIGLGSVSITASQAGNTNYNPATEVVRTFQILYPTSTQPSVAVGEVVAFPNPSKSGVFEVRGLQSIDKQQVSYVVIDASGKQIASGIWVGKDVETLNLSAFAKGLYILDLRGSKTQTTKKIVKQ